MARQLRELDEELVFVRAGKPLPPEFQQRHAARRLEQAEFYTHYVAPAMSALVARVQTGTDTEADRRILGALHVPHETFRSDTKR